MYTFPMRFCFQSFALLIFLNLAAPLHAQDKESFRKNQKLLDGNYGGIGFELTTPNYGDRIRIDESWVGFNVLADKFEFRWVFGKALLSEPEPEFGFGDKLPPPRFGYRFAAGSDVSVGGSFPFTGLRFGAQNNSLMVGRIHPVFNFQFGKATFREQNTSGRKDGFWYTGVGFGARLRFPIVSVEPSFRANIGFQTGDNFDAFKWFSLGPSVIIRFDARKQKLDPTMVTVPTNNWSVQNYSSSSSSRTYTTYQGGRTTKVTETTTVTSYDVKVTKGSVGVQDIGSFLGIGPKIAINNYFASNYIPRGQLIGVGMHGRSGPGFFGINIEGGTIGHGSVLEDSDAIRKGADDKENFGMGTYRSFQMYADIGFDLSPFLMSVLGVTREESNATSFTSVVGGYSLGYAFISNQQFQNNFAEQSYTDPSLVAESIYNLPSQGKSGYLGGFFLGIEVGVVGFRVQRFHYRKAPLANNTYFSITYRFPLD